MNEQEIQWCHKQMRPSAHFASVLSTHNLQTHPLRENSQEQNFLEFRHRLQRSGSENPKSNIKSSEDDIFWEKKLFDRLSQIEESIFWFTLCSKMPLNILRFQPRFGNRILVENDTNLQLIYTEKIHV